MTTQPTDQTVLITAGASGIGHAMGKAFEAAGAQVWVVDQDADALAACPDTWQRTQVDVADAHAMAALFVEISDHWGRLDVLCANAGIAGQTAAVEDQEIAQFRACVSVNLDGAFLACKGALPLMKAASAGTILFTSSTAGLYGYPYRAPYAATKWAIHGLMKTVAMEAGPHGIRANVIAPGSVDGARMTGVIAREAAAKGVAPQIIRDGYAAGTSLRTFVEADDIAAMAVFLASDGAKRVSGQIIAVDGHTENPDPKPVTQPQP